MDEMLAGDRSIDESRGLFTGHFDARANPALTRDMEKFEARFEFSVNSSSAG